MVEGESGVKQIFLKQERLGGEVPISCASRIDREVFEEFFPTVRITDYAQFFLIKEGKEEKPYYLKGGSHHEAKLGLEEILGREVEVVVRGQIMLGSKGEFMSINVHEDPGG